ncbi:MAG: LysR substrate-binding domain-containing protein [Roseovarius sp.]
MQPRNLPPLDLLVPFEASARLGSFTRAAEELSVTQSAVSQRVRTLESILNTALFTRSHRAISLTDEGRELFNGVKIALQHLSAATVSMQHRDARPVLRLAVDTSIGAFWLTPRLSSFLRAHPPLMVDVNVSDDEAEILGADVVVLHGSGTWPGFTARLLFGDEVTPVCAPSYLAKCPVATAQDLLEADLIDLDYKQWNWMNWGIWLTEKNMNPSEARVLIRTDSYAAQIDAARAGLGIALGWSQLLDEDLATGRLVKPIEASVQTSYGYYLLLRHGADETAHALADHMCAYMRGSAA